MIANWMVLSLDYGLQFIHESSILAETPWLGRFAFASVFMALIAWLIWIPSEKLQANAELDRNGNVPSVAHVRILAIAIAAIQVGLYLFWS